MRILSTLGKTLRIIFVLFAVLGLFPGSMAFAKKKGPAKSEPPIKLVIKDKKNKKGKGAAAKVDQTVSVHYTGWLYDPAANEGKGKKFDSSVDRGQPFSFKLGQGQVIKGWDEGVAGMKLGGQRTLIIPPDMGYGANGAGAAIPPNAALIFDIELLKIE